MTTKQQIVRTTRRCWLVGWMDGLRVLRLRSTRETSAATNTSRSTGSDGQPPVSIWDVANAQFMAKNISGLPIFLPCETDCGALLVSVVDFIYGKGRQLCNTSYRIRSVNGHSRYSNTVYSFQSFVSLSRIQPEDTVNTLLQVFQPTDYHNHSLSQTSTIYVTLTHYSC